jgi:hypothetical protein
MTPEEFVQHFAKEHQHVLRSACDSNSDSIIAKRIQELDLTADQREKLRATIGALLTDVMYTVLLALDGEANLGDHQETYKLFSRDGTELTASGEIEAFAWEYFHGSKRSDA